MAFKLFHPKEKNYRSDCDGNEDATSAQKNECLSNEISPNPRLNKLDRFVEDIGQRGIAPNLDADAANRVEKHLGSLHNLIEETRNQIEQHSSLEVENFALKRELSELQLALEQERNAAAEQNKKFLAQDNRLSETRAGLQTSHLEVSNLTRQIGFLREQVSQLRSSLYEAESSLSEERGLSAELSIERDRLANELVSVQSQAATSRLMANETQEKIEDIKGLLAADITYREKLNNEYDVLQHRVSDLETEKIELGSLLDVAHQDLQHLRANSSDELAMQQKANLLLEAKVATLEADKAAYRAEIQALSNLPDQSSSEAMVDIKDVEQLRHKLDEVTSKLSVERADTLSYMTQLTRQDHKVSSLQDQKRAINDELKAFKASQRLALKENKSLARQVKKLEAIVAKRKPAPDAQQAKRRATADKATKLASDVTRSA